MTSFSVVKRNRLNLKRDAKLVRPQSEEQLPVDLSSSNVSGSSVESAKLKTIQKTTRKQMFSLGTAHKAARNLIKLFTRTKVTDEKSDIKAVDSVPASLHIIESSSIEFNSQRIPLATSMISKSNKSMGGFETVKIAISALDKTLLGFTVAGYCPCHVAKLETDSLAARAGLQIGDLIIKINGKNVSRAKCDSIAKIIK